MSDQEKKQFQRKINAGDFGITGESSNGVSITKDGNIFQYTGNNSEYLDNLRDNNYNGFIDPNDPNNAGSFIGMILDGVSPVDLGSKNQSSLNIVNNPQEIIQITKRDLPADRGKGFIIGDSLTALIKKNSRKLEPITTEGQLWQVGWNMKNLSKALSASSVIYKDIKHLFISIGTNDGFKKDAGLVNEVIKNAKAKFPDATLYLIKGSIGWGNNVGLTQQDVDDFAKLWTSAGTLVLFASVGRTNAHPGLNTKGIVDVALEIDEILSTELPIIEKEIKPKVNPKSNNDPNKTESENNTKDNQTEDIIEYKYPDDYLPDDEGEEIFNGDDEKLNSGYDEALKQHPDKLYNANDPNVKKEKIQKNFTPIELGEIGKNVTFYGAWNGCNAKADWENGIINPNLVKDIATAAKAAGVVATITTAKTGHRVNTKSGSPSRHTQGTGVDIAVIDGLGAGGATNSSNGNPTFREKGNRLCQALESMGYARNKESGQSKAVLWQTNTGGNHYNHLHVSRRG
jgi:hypothetical protein